MELLLLLLPDMESPMLLTLWALLVLPLLLSLVLLEDMLEQVDTLPTLLVPFMLPREKLRPMLGFSMEAMDMVLAMLVLVMLVLDTVILPMDTMVRDLLKLSQRLRLVQDFSMEDTGLVSDMLDTAMESLLMDTLLLAIMAKGLLMLMLDIFMVAMDMDLALDTVLDTVDTTMDKPLAKCLSKSSKATLM